MWCRSISFNLASFNRYLPRKNSVAMSTFVPRVSPVTGKIDWCLEDENYDFHQEIARSGYADMLHDTERNKKYYAALKKAITTLKNNGQPVKVLDIGTGTGLLSMMAAKQKVDTITACEAFEPMAACAKLIMKENGFADSINIVQKRSTEMTVGEDGDMSQRANILVTEVFDTELIGEGAISTFSHAHRELLEKDSIVVPHAANMYVQLVSSAFLKKWNQIQPVQIPDAEDIQPPEELSWCGGVPSLHDLQMDQLSKEQFQPLTEPCKVFRFDYSGECPFPPYETSTVVSQILADGQVDAVLMWWDLEMDRQGEIILSCAPNWAHPDPSNMQWRDHWMQAIYYPPATLNAAAGDSVQIISNHDEYSLWFDVSKTTEDTSTRSSPERPMCTCGAHVLYSRTRLGMLNDTSRQETYIKMLKKYIQKDSVCICLGDGSLLSLMVARLGASKVFAIEPGLLCSRMVKSFIKHNGLDDKVTVLQKSPDDITAEDLEGMKVNFIISEPHFQTSILPWHNMHVWYSASDLKSRVCPGAQVLPASMKIKGICVEFKDLWKIRAPVGNCEGFNLKIFDDLIQKSSDISDAVIEPHPLWEYPCTALTAEQTLFSADFTQSVSSAENATSEVTFNFESAGTCNGVALWTEFCFGEDFVVSCGPRQTPGIGKPILWDFYSRQGVHLLYTPVTVGPGENTDSEHSLKARADFKPQSGDLQFSFQLNS